MPYVTFHPGYFGIIKIKLFEYARLGSAPAPSDRNQVL
jgi:hypothetical protein